MRGPLALGVFAIALIGAEIWLAHRMADANVVAAILSASAGADPGLLAQAGGFLVLRFGAVFLAPALLGGAAGFALGVRLSGARGTTSR